MSRRSTRPVRPSRLSRRLHLALEGLEDRQLLAAYVVTSAADDGSMGTLRSQIAQADMDPTVGAVSISFAIPGGSQTIALKSALPAITRPVGLDAEETGYAGTPQIRIDGSAVPAGADGLSFTGASGGSTVRGLAIGGFNSATDGSGGAGIFVAATSAGNLFLADYLGIDPNGVTPRPNAQGIEIDSSGNTIGGTSAANRNVISDNAVSGVLIFGNPASSNLVEGDYLGVDAAGDASSGNLYGVVLAGPGNTVGGITAGARNVISGNVGPQGMTGIGVLLEGAATANTVEGNYIGTDLTGSVAVADVYGIYFGNPGGSTTDLTSQDTIGGTVAGAGNLISGDFIGITGKAAATGALIAGNTLGLNAAGTAIPTPPGGVFQGGDDILLGISGSTIGGTTAAARNIISGMAAASTGGTGLGLAIAGNADVVEGNYIGTNAAGTAAVANLIGASLSLTSSTIGGTAAGAGNVISGNTGDGVELDGNSGNLIEGNLIGSVAAGNSPLGNGGNGIALIVAAPATAATSPLALNDTIGAATAGAGNLIAENHGAGITLESSYGAAVTGLNIRGNGIFSNGGLGIYLGSTGLPTPGTLFLTSTTTTAGATTINGTFAGAPGTVATIDFYASQSADPSGFGEGQTYLGSVVVTTDASGLASFAPTFTSVASSETVFSATSTDSNGTTSEFSLDSPTPATIQPAELVLAASATPASVTLNGPVTLTETITNNGPGAATGVVFYDTLPNTLVNGSVTTTAGTASVGTNNLVSANLGTIAPGATVTVTITANASQLGSVTNTGGVSSTTLDANYANNEASQSLTVVPATPLNADVAITIAPSPVTPTVGQNLFYTLTITNNGPSAATNVTVNDFLPANATLLNVVPSQGGYASLTGSLISDNLGTIASGSNATIVIVVKPTATGTIVNSANASGNQPDPVTSNNSASSTLTVGLGGTTALALSQTETPLVGAPGQIQIFTITLKNTGTAEVDGTTLVDVLPSGVTFVLAAPSQGGPASMANGTITDNPGPIAVGATVTLTIVVVPTTSTTLTNTAGVVATGIAPQFSQAVLAVPNGPSVIGVVGTKGNSQLIANFNEPLTPTSASNPANYQLYALGHTPRAVNGKDKSIKINSAVYISQTNGVVFTPASPLDATQYYALVIVGSTSTGITDTAGRKLIGATGGQTGTNFAATFLASSLPQI